MNTEFLAEKRKLLQEMADLEISRAELQMQVERAVRDKRSVELETEKIRKQVPLEIERLHGLIEELQERQRRLERERDDALFQLERSVTGHQRKENDFEKMKHQLCFDADLTEKRLKKVEGELLQTKNENVALFKKISDLEQVHRQTVEQNQSEKQQAEIDVATTRRQFDRQVFIIWDVFDRIIHPALSSL